jgi:hypothetical protein
VFLRSFNTASAPTYTFETKPATGTVWSSYTLYQSSGKWQHAPIVSTFGLHDYRWKVTFADASYAYWPYHQTSGFLKLETRSYASFSWMVNNTDYDQYYPTSAGWYYKGKGNNYGTPYFGLQNVGYTISKWLISPKVGRIKELRFNQDGSTPGDAQTIVSRSTDGVNWTTVATFSSTLGGNPAARVATLNLSAENYIRIHPNNNTWNNYVRLVNAYLIPY